MISQIGSTNLAALEEGSAPEINTETQQNSEVYIWYILFVRNVSLLAYTVHSRLARQVSRFPHQDDNMIHVPVSCKDKQDSRSANAYYCLSFANSFTPASRVRFTCMYSMVTSALRFRPTWIDPE